MITRPILRYHGGKYILAKWIIGFFPDHKIYTECFGGAASVLFQKEKCYAEVYNDLDKSVVNLFEVVRDNGNELKNLLINTPFSREEFNLSYEISDNKMENARRLVVRSFMGFGSASASGRKTGFRSCSNRSGTTPAHDWKNYPAALDAIIERLKGVVIENRNAIDVINQHDSKDTLHFLDPPYVLSTRYNLEKTKCYNFEMTDTDHELLLKNICKVKGSVVLSGYESDLYNDVLAGWYQYKKKSFADGAKEREEVIYLNPLCESLQVKKLSNQIKLF